jgi:hypothetical protein
VKHLMKGTLAVIAALVLTLTLNACGSTNATLAVPQSFCGFIQGKGGRDNSNNANNAQLGQILYQGQSADYHNDQQDGWVFPCVTRNYVVSDQSVSGDSHTALAGRTSNGTPVGGWVTVYWQPNQSNRDDQGNPIKQFIGLCQGKYGCAASDPTGFTGQGNVNASTPGWNKMLSENMYPVLQRIFERATLGVDDAVWRNQDPNLREQVAAKMGDEFAAEFQKVTGSTTDLICGSGSTGTGDTFDCKGVYIVVDGLWASQGNMQGDAAKAAEDNAKRALDDAAKQADIDLTNAKYGPLAPAYRACRDLNAAVANSCKFVVGPNGVQIPVS